MTTTTTTEKRITIALSDAPPVRVNSEVWPLIARADWVSNYPECQANEVATIKVREHESGRRIVYGVRGRGSGGMPIDYRGKHAGYLVDSHAPGHREIAYEGSVIDEETIRAIRRVAGVLEMPDLGDECIADLPARDL